MSDLPDRAADTDPQDHAPAAAPMTDAAALDTDPLAGVMSGREAAAALGVSERTIRRAIQRGDLNAIKHAGSFHITPAALEAYRQRMDTGQHTLSHAATSDRADNTTAAAPDRTADTPRAAAAAEDTGHWETGAERVLRELLAEERRKSDALLEAATVWQARAMQLESELKALQPGPIAQAAGNDTFEKAPAEPLAANEIIGDYPSKPISDTMAFSWRRWWRRITGTE